MLCPPRLDRDPVSLTSEPGHDPRPRTFQLDRLDDALVEWIGKSRKDRRQLIRDLETDIAHHLRPVACNDGSSMRLGEATDIAFEHPSPHRSCERGRSNHLLVSTIGATDP